MDTANCWNCKEDFEVDANDIRPFVYHRCKDKKTGKLVSHGVRNPNIKKKKPIFYNKPATTTPKKDHLLREYYGYGHALQKIEEDEEE